MDISKVRAEFANFPYTVAFLDQTQENKTWHSRSFGIRNRNIDDTWNTPGDFSVIITQKIKGEKFAVWRPRKFYIYPGYDVAIIIDEGYWNDEAAKLMEAKAYPHIGFDLHKPRIGAGVIAKGYPEKSSFKYSRGYYHVLSLETYTGVVEEVYDEGAPMVKSPCFQSTVKTYGGMSGGPIFNAANSRIIGITSANLETTDPPFHTTFAPFLWHAFLAPIEVPLAGAGTTSILELAKREFLHIEGVEHVSQGADGRNSWIEFVETCATCQISQEP